MFLIKDIEEDDLEAAENVYDGDLNGMTFNAVKKSNIFIEPLENFSLYDTEPSMSNAYQRKSEDDYSRVFGNNTF